MTDTAPAPAGPAARISTRTTPPDAPVRALARRLVTPLCGLVPTLGITAGRRRDPRLTLATGDLTGVHRLLDAEMPGSYNIGACGTSLEDVVLRSLAEAVERYCPMAAALTRPVVHARHRDMLERNSGRVLPEADLARFTPEQYARRGFPFQPYDPDRALGWTSMRSLADGADWWVPAQLTLAGHAARGVEGEPRLGPAVSTGTAAHTDPGRALLGAVQELVQLDAVMGHWYTDAPATRVLPDARTRALQEVIAARWEGQAPAPEFHLLSSPDLPGFSVVCLMRSTGGASYTLGAGLGADLSLVRAMYKALMEAVSVVSLVRWKFVERAREGTAPPAADQIYDIENNVLHYATPRHASVVLERFARSGQAAAGDLAPDVTGDARTLTRHLVDAFVRTGKRLFYADLTTRDARRLGFTVARVWSPDTLSLCLASAPPAAHPRFADFGGFTHDRPHPYP